jgi:membrane associated rhomboid family serine protease
MAMLIPIKDLNPYKRFPVVTVVLIAANVLVFLMTTTSLFGVPSNETVAHYGSFPCDVLNRCPVLSHQLEAAFPSRSPLVSVLTSMFMHSGILHLGFNMLFLWVFGNNVEDRLGRIRYPIFYLAAGLAAAFAHMSFAVATNNGAEVPIVGASGAISGVLGAYIVLWPRATIVSLLPLGFFFTTIRTPAWVALGLWFLVQFLGGVAGLGQTSGGGVAYLAHIGGFVAGVVLIFVFGGYRRPQPAFDDWAR